MRITIYRRQSSRPECPTRKAEIPATLSGRP